MAAAGPRSIVKDGTVVKVEGNEEHPYHQGRLCPRALALTQYIHHPDRLRHPLKRVGERGSGKWERISWDEALDTCEAKMRDLRDKYGAECMIFGQGTGRDSGGPIIFLAYAYGSPNWTLFGLSGIACFTPRLASCFQVMGDMTFPDAAQFFPQRYDDPDWKCPELIVSWARNLQGSQCADHYFSGHYVIDMMKRGAKLMVVDPYNGWEAGRAELWLRVRPGTDGALALGMIKVIIEENLYDKEFVEKWTFGFDKLKAEVAKYSLDDLSQITWVPTDKIVKAARMYAAAKPAQMRFGQPLDSNAEAVATVHGLASLWALTGNIDNPGGNVISRPAQGVTIYPYSTEEVIQLYGQEFVDKMNQKRIGADKYPLVKNFRSWAMSDDVLEQMETGKPYPIKGLWCQTNNFLAGTAQDPRRHYEAVRKLEFNVVVDTFMTPTAQAIADIVLPAAAITEKDSAFTTGVPCNPIYKVAETDEARMDWEINFELARRLNPDAVPWPNVRALLDQRLSVTGHTFESLKEAGLLPGAQGRPHHALSPPRERPAAPRRPAGLPHAFGQIRVLQPEVRGVRPEPAAAPRGAHRERGQHARDPQGVPADPEHRPPGGRHVPLRAPHDPLAARDQPRSAGGDPPRYRRQVRHQGRRLGAHRGHHGQGQAQGRDHAADAPGRSWSLSTAGGSPRPSTRATATRTRCGTSTSTS